MKIIDTEIIRGINQDFTLDLQKDSDGALFLDIHQSNDGSKNQLLSIDVHDLSVLIQGLQKYYDLISIAQPNTPKHLTPKAANRMVEYFYKNVPIKDIAILFDVSISQVERVLHSKGIEL